jgi:hypothetical protein
VSDVPKSPSLITEFLFASDAQKFVFFFTDGTTTWINVPAAEMRDYRKWAVRIEDAIRDGTARGEKHWLEAAEMLSNERFLRGIR